MTDFFWRCRNFAETRLAQCLLFLWSFCEAVCWFILPDFILMPLAFLAPRKSCRFIILSITGSCLGTIILLLLLQQSPRVISSLIFKLPFTHIDMLGKIDRLAAHGGILATLGQPVSGVPAKVWTINAIVRHWNPAVFMMLLTLARGLRMGIVGMAGRWLSNFTEVARRFWLAWVIAYCAVFWLLLAVSSGSLTI